MTEQEKLEKVLKGLMVCFTRISCKGKGCPYESEYERSRLCQAHLRDDALALLKAQEPRVMTLEEVQQHNNQDGCVWFEQPTYNAVAAFVRKDEFEIEVISPYILGEPINHGYWLSSNYNVTWRCWTSRPDQATREATPWKIGW